MKSEKEMLLLFGKAMNEVTNVYHMKFKDKKEKTHFVCTQWFKNYLLITESYNMYKERYNADDYLTMQLAIYKHIKSYEIKTKDKFNELCAMYHYDRLYYKIFLKKDYIIA
jgi:hypothetical protein